MAGRLVSPVIVGRRRELELATAALDTVRAANRTDDAAGGTPRHLVIAGEAGVGKSRLASELAAVAREHGFRVLRGGCTSVGDEGLPYGPVVEILDDLVRSLDAPTLHEVIGSAGPDLARLVPSIDPAVADATVQREYMQTRLLDALAGMLRRLAALAPVLVVIEDVHWADPATRDVIGFLVRGTRSDRLVLALTLRSDELHRRHPVLPWLAELERSGRTDRLDLARLGLEDTAGMLEAILGHAPDPELADRIHRRSDGNPFFIEELLAAEDRANPAQVPATLQGILLARLAAVPESVQALLGAVAVAGRRVDHDLLAEVVPEPEAELLASLRSAVGRGILLADADAAGREGYAFRHALLAEVTYDELLPGERRRLHRAFAQALADRPEVGGASATRWAELAHHWSMAREDERAFDASIRAGEAAERAFAFEAALRDREHALELWAGVPGAEALAGADRAEILARAAHAAYLAGLQHRAVALQREAVGEVDAGVAPLRAAAMRAKLGRLSWMAGDAAGALTHCETAVATIPAEPPTAERAQVLGMYGQLLMLLDRFDEARVLCEEAIDVAQRVGALETEGHARSSLGLALVALGRTDTGIATLRRAIEIADETGSVDDIGRGHVNLVSSLLYSAQVEEAAAAAEAGMRVAEALGIAATYGAFVGHNLVQVDYERGEWDRSAALAEELGIATARPPLSRYALVRWIPLLVARGEHEEARVQLERLRQQLDGYPVEGQFHGGYQVARAELALWEGRADDALAIVEAAFAQLAGADWTFYHARLYRLGARAAADVAVTARARRDGAALAMARERAERLRVAGDDWFERRLDVQSEIHANEIRAEAATLRAEGSRLDGAPDPAAWAEAAGRWRAHGRPYLLGYTRWREAEARLESGDRAGATEALREAAAIAGRLGARPLAEAIASLAARARLDVASAREPAATSAGGAAESAASAEAAEGPGFAPAPVAPPPDPYGLTRREREVLGLLALGRTNRQIADALFISENTAGVHVSNILGKLGVSSRTEAATLAVRAGYSAEG